MSQINQNHPLKIGYNSRFNIKWLLKVEYLLNGSKDLLNLNQDMFTDYQINFRKDPCVHEHTKCLIMRARVYAQCARASTDL